MGKSQIIPGSFNLKFEHIAFLINAIKKSGIESDIYRMAYETARAFINHCGRALKCYSSDYVKDKLLNEGETAESVLTDLFKHLSLNRLGLDNSLLTDFPWLYFEARKSQVTSWQSPVTFSGYYYIDSDPRLLIQQMRSMDFARSTRLPTDGELAKVSSQMSSYAFHSKTVRKEFVTAQIKDGCAIMYQDAAFRPLNQSEIKIASEYMAKHSKVNYKNQNLTLCETFFRECVAVEVDGSAQKKRLDALLLLLSNIDNKPYYNDLGQVLGLLIQYSKKQKGQQKYYTLEQLTSWLDSLLDPVHMENSHYPINILTMILDLQLRDHEAETNSTLLNSDLNQLKSSITPDQLRKNIVDIVRSENLPGQYKPVLAKYALHYAYDYRFINQARETIEKLHKQEVNSSWLTGICEFIGSLQQQNETVYNNRIKILNQITQNADRVKIDPTLSEAWQATQIKLIELYQQKNPNFDLDEIDTFEMRTSELPKDAYIRMILLQALTDLDITKTEENLKAIQSDRTRKAGGLAVVSSHKGCRRLVQTNFKNYLSHQHRSFYRAAPDFEYIP
ncbi:MAG: hypothetical protein ACRCXC_04560 [Legionella sp.]